MNTTHHFQMALKQYPLLTSEEEHALLSEYARTRNVALRNKLVNHNMRLVLHVCQEIGGRFSADPDLHAEATIGLITAADRFDMSKTQKFSTYAVSWIRERVFDWLPKQKALTLSKNKFYAVQAAKKKAEASGGEMNDDDFMALGKNIEQVKKFTSLCFAGEVSLDASIRSPDGDAETTGIELLSDGVVPEENIESIIAHARWEKDLEKFKLSLSPKEKVVFSERVLNEDQLDVVGQKIQCTGEYVRQLETKIKTKFKRFAERHRMAELIPA